MDEVADYFFGLSKLIAVRRVDEVAAGFGVSIKNFSGVRALGAVTPAGTEVACAQRQFRYSQASSPSENLGSPAILLARMSDHSLACEATPASGCLDPRNRHFLFENRLRYGQCLRRRKLWTPDAERWLGCIFD